MSTIVFPSKLVVEPQASIPGGGVVVIPVPASILALPSPMWGANFSQNTPTIRSWTVAVRDGGAATLYTFVSNGIGTQLFGLFGMLPLPPNAADIRINIASGSAVPAWILYWGGY